MEVVILCGGKGTRSYPFTDHFPKPMMPICGTPMLVHLMRFYAQQGFTDFVLAAGHRKDVLDDRVAFFNTRLNAGTYTYTYLARVTHAGTFHALPAQVYLMYADDWWGRSASDEVVFED